jgi:hypothetical protein
MARSPEYRRYGMTSLYTPKTDPTWNPPIDYTRCRAQTYDNISRNFSQCARKKAVERDGVGYCKQHDPEAEKARADARRQREEAEVRARECRWKRPIEYRDALREIASGHNDARELARKALEAWGDA